jgi:60 kDa SS-A/Ro ribonucleoprotein
VYQADDRDRVLRFLILGSASNFYQSGQDLSEENADLLISYAEREHGDLLELILSVSQNGRAPKQQPGLFALAIAASYGTTEEKAAALEALPEVARTASTLFTFLNYVQNFRGWGPALAKAVSSWYGTKTMGQIAYQAVKYRQRDGWTHRDVWRKAHPTFDPDAGMGALRQWITKGELTENAPAIVRAFEEAKTASPERLIELTQVLPWEALPTEALNKPDVWRGLLAYDRVPLGALIRQLPRLASIGVTDDRDIALRIATRLTSVEELRRARIHPMNVLVAQKTYASGQSRKLSFSPNAVIVDALDDAFYGAFGNVTPTGKRMMLALDVSGSMTYGNVGGLPITPAVGAAAMALITRATEKDAQVMAFNTGFIDVSSKVTPRRRLDDVVRDLYSMGFGGTDTSLPMRWATEKRRAIDTFVVYTDNETWAGTHPDQALRRYREVSGINAKLVVVGMTATRFTVADPKDPGMLDVAGFDTATPQIISEFAQL